MGYYNTPIFQIPVPLSRLRGTPGNQLNDRLTLHYFYYHKHCSLTNLALKRMLHNLLVSELTVLLTLPYVF